MARAPRQPAAASPSSPDERSERVRIVETFMSLLDEKAFEEVGLAETAERAGVSLAELRNAFASKLMILAAYLKEIDRQVLAGIDADMAEEPPRERLFDVLMRRIDALSPHKAAVRSLIRSAARNPGLAFALNGFAVRSQQWMLTAADISAAGPRGMLRAQGLALLFAAVLRTWLHDDDPGLAPTMSALDKALGRGQRYAGFLDDLCRIPACVCRMRPRRRRRDAEEETVAA
ncbi:MAG TPA: TetR/AcrR family transcriptional regulator [Xanthobacteraceae bacterium]